MNPACTFCGGEVDERSAFRRVSGWERKAVVASRKGGSDIVLRQSHDELACFACITRLRAGVNVAQESLV